MAPFHFYEAIFDKVDASLTTYISDVATNVISSITPVAKTMLLIYFVLWGWSTLRGMINEPITDGTTRLLRLSIICALALNVGRYNGYISDFLWNSPDAISAYVTSTAPTSSSSGAFLDALMTDAYALGEMFWAKASAASIVIPDVGLIIVALVIWGVAIFLTGFAAFLLCLAKVGLAVVLAIGPIFILLTIFEATKKFFDSWLGLALNFIFTVMLTAAVIKLILSLAQSYLLDLKTVMSTGSADPSTDQVVPLFALCLIGILALLQVPGWASSLGGGVALSTMGAVGWALEKTKATMSALRPTNLKRSLNKLKSDFRIAKNATKAVGSAPMAVYRKIIGSNINKIRKI